MSSLKIVCCTWNVHATPPPKEDLREILHLYDDKPLPDIVAVGLQEVEVRPHSFVVEMIQENKWVQVLQDYLGYYGLVRVRSLRMLGMIIVVAVKVRHLPYLREIKTSFVRTAVMGWLGTKGAVAVRFVVHGHSFCFINCHFTAHLDGAKQRNSNFESVLKYMKFADVPAPTVMEHDFVAVLGDLNYRIDEVTVGDVKAKLASGDLVTLKKHDQLVKVMSEEKVYEGFFEHEISFQPTYKYCLGSNDWDASDLKRKPAWCDRIIWHEGTQGHTDVTSYTSHPRHMTSDHQPVSAECTASIDSLEANQDSKIVWKLEIESMPWYGNDDGLCVYVVKDYKPYSWDWIGLYRLGWQHFTDYEMYEWAVGDGDEYGENGCAVLFDCLPEEPGLFQLCYFSYKMDCFIAVSEPFEILKPRDEDVDPVEVNIEKPTLAV